VHGLVVLGTCGENNSLEPDEKRQVLQGRRRGRRRSRADRRRRVRELTTPRAAQFARDAEKPSAPMR
jgi:dihydrodipicolinate synthase/N-acetylneuraminate lyase